MSGPFDPVAHYRADAEAFDYETDIAFVPDDDRRKESVARLWRWRAGERILEIGSGAGWLTLLLAARGCRVVPFDLSERNLARIREKNPSVSPVFGESGCLPFARGVFDGVLAIEVLEHFPEPARALAEIRRVLRPGGRLVASVPYKERIEYNLCIHCNRPTPKSAHLHSFTEETFVGLVEGAGFAVQRRRYFLNKGISLLRLNALVAWLPYAAWRPLDALANRITDKATYIGVVARVPEG